MQKFIVTALAAAGLLAASQVSFANPLSPNLDGQKAPVNSAVIPAKVAGGRMGGSGSFGPSISGPMHSGHMFAAPGHFSHFHHHHGHFGPFVGFGLDYGYPDWYGGGSCYWNCRNEGHGPRYCQAYAGNFCY